MSDGKHSTELWWVRHGETEWNQVKRYQGQEDSALTVEGLWQAHQAAARFQITPPDVIYSSDLGRALHTAEIIAAACGLEVRPEPRLRERHFGIFQGLTIDEVAVQYPQAHERFRTERHYVPDNGESPTVLLERLMSCVEELATQHDGKRILLLSHGGAISAFIKEVLGLAPDAPRHFRLPNVSLNVISRENGGHWRLDSLGDVSHLKTHQSIDDETAG